MSQVVKRALVILAQGFEEVEAITPVDYLRRAEIEVITAALDKDRLVTGSRGIPVMADTTLKSLAEEKKFSPSHWDAVILPGGLPGSNNLAASNEVTNFIIAMAGDDKWVCAICAAPALVLGPLDLLTGRKFTCYPGLEEKVKGANWQEDRVIIDINPAPKKSGIITSRGAGTAGEFAAAIISSLLNDAKGKEIAEKVLLKF